jgi:phosphoglycolate phosphatase
MFESADVNGKISMNEKRTNSALQRDLRCVLFDLDGTLVDHFEAICRCYNEVLQEFHCPPIPFATLKARIGPPIGETAKELLKTDDGETITRFGNRYREIMEGTFCDGLYLLPGAHWLLDQLRKNGLKLAILTNKQQSQAERVCEAVNLCPFVEEIMGTEEGTDCLRKPDPAFTGKILKILKAQPGCTAMVGDSPFDMATGHLAHLKATYAVTTGTHGAESLRNGPHVPTKIFSNLWELGENVFGFAR